MTVVVTGASGHVGANLVRELVGQGADVRALVFDDVPSLEGLSVERATCDVRDLDALRDAFDGADIVYHLAAIIALTPRDKEVMEAVNVQGTANVVKACLDCSVSRMVHVSSSHACCALPADEPIDETRPLADTQPCPDYDRSKAQAERAVQAGIEAGLDGVIACPSGILGPYDFGLSHMAQTLLALYRGRIPALVAGGYDWVDVRDVVSGLTALADRGRRGERYLLTGNWVSVVDLAAIWGEVTGRKMPSLAAPLWLALAFAPLAERLVQLAGRRPLFTSASIHTLASRSRFRNDKACQEIGHRPRPLKETLEATFKWFREAGML